RMSSASAQADDDGRGAIARSGGRFCQLRMRGRKPWQKCATRPTGDPCGRVDRNGAGWMGAHAPLDWAEAGEAPGPGSVSADLHVADEAAMAVVARGEVAIRVVGARSHRTEGQPDADATPAPAMAAAPVMGLSLGGARHRNGADGERSDESGSNLGLHGVFLR